MTLNVEFQELQDRLRTFSESVPGILRRLELDGRAGRRNRADAAVVEGGASEEHFTLAVAGQMRVGKSTLINAMIGADLAIPGVTETTATVNWLRHGTVEQAASIPGGLE